MKIILFLVLVVVVFAGFVLAVEKDMKLSLSPIFSEHMVLQRDVPLEIFGMASPGKKIIVDIAGQSVVGIVSKNGEWTVKLLPITAGGPYELKVICGNEIIHFTDVLAGDVWFCSGQSNMEWILGNTFDGADELKNFKPQPNIRLFLQQQKALPTPLKEAAGVWTECTADNTKTFSAVAYFFAKHLQKEINIPIGLIDSSWGGTSIEIWIKESLLKGNPVTQPIIDRWKSDPIYDWKNWNNGNGMDFSLELSDIRFESSKGRAKPLFVDTQSKWNANAKQESTIIFTPGKTSKLSGVIGFNAWANADTAIQAGADADLTVYDTIKFKVKGMGKFSVSLGQTSITDYDYYSSLDHDATTKWQEIHIPIDSLKQGGWGLAKSFTKEAVNSFKINIKLPTVELPSALYNGMVAPFVRFKIKGALWYQGENNTGRAKQYGTLLPLMINNWRDTWGIGDFPFIVVQLPNFMERKLEPAESAWAELREAQLKALDLPNTAVVPIIDLGEANDVHPRYKEPVGVRLAQAAMVVAYQKEPPATGPIYDSMTVVGNKIIIKFKNIKKGLEAKNGDLKGFAIAGDEQEFVWAKAEIKDDTVIVWNDNIKEPKAVRYAWADNPECNLYNKEGLAASPFRTDAWQGETDNNY